MITVKRALLSCHDKTGLAEFAKGLAALGVELVASGGTAKALQEAGLKIRTVEEFAGIGEQLDGRVKTLHPVIHGGILARRDDPAHVKAVGPEKLIDLVVVNLYPFERTIAKPGTSLGEAVEQIDIGGVALLRAAAKNFPYVAVVCQPAQYAPVAAALRGGKGTLPDALGRELALAAFELTSFYDAGISGYLAAEPPTPEGTLPGSASLRLIQKQPLRYGENPHQPGAWYVPVLDSPVGLGTLRQLQGKELSYNNLLDADAALRCLMDFAEPTCSIVKHNSQCGVASGATAAEAYERAFACDPESSFGGIVGFNRPVDEAAAAKLTETFLEVILAPAVEAPALSLLKKKPNVRVITVAWPSPDGQVLEWRQLLGGWLLQGADAQTKDAEGLKVVTKRSPSAKERQDLLFAWTVAKHVKSNAVVLASEQATVGIGQGQPSRVGAVRVALEKAGARAKGAVAASDGFFPFPDGVALLANAGVTAVVQPGGSIRDQEVTAAADAGRVTMAFTGIRHFRH